MAAHPIIAIGILGVLLAVLVFFLRGITYVIERLQGTRMSRGRHIIGVIGVAVGILVVLKATFFVLGILLTDLDKLSHPKLHSTQGNRK